MSDSIDVDKFIVELQQRPALWNSESKDMSNKILKNKAWEELCEIFFENYKDKETNEKNEYSK